MIHYTCDKCHTPSLHFPYEQQLTVKSASTLKHLHLAISLHEDGEYAHDSLCPTCLGEVFQEVLNKMKETLHQNAPLIEEVQTTMNYNTVLPFLS